jgi:hypothetical protein
MPVLTCDSYGHIDSPANVNVLAAAAVSTTVAGTIVGTTNAGAAPTVTAVTANDNYGTYTLNPVTGGGAQAAGATSTVFFAQSFRKTPASVRVTVTNITVPATPTAVAAYATSVTSAGFSVTTALLVTANNYLVTYEVLL